MQHLERALEGQNSIWKYIVGVLVSLIVANIVGAIVILGYVTIYYIRHQTEIDITKLNISDLSAIGISTNTSVVLMLIPFVAGLLSIIIFCKYVHKQSFSEVVNGTKKARWKRVFFGFGLWFLIMGLSSIYEYYSGLTQFIFQFDVKQFIPLLFIAIILLPIQTTYEELLIRGYMTQGIAKLTKSRWVSLILPAILFGLMHIANPEVGKYGILHMMPSYILMGLIFGITVILDDGLELAMGIHAANNIFICLFTTNASSALRTPAVFEINDPDPTLSLTLLIIGGIILITILYKKYNWSFSTLNKKIVKETNTI